MATTQDYINQLKVDKQNLVTMLNNMGVEATDNETFTSLTPKVGKIVTDPILQDKSITITENGTTNIVADEGYNGLNNVDVIVEVEGAGTGEVIDMYSTDEIKTNKIWIDGKPIYRKVVYCGALPNAQIKQVEHHITNLDHFTSCDAVAYTDDKTTFFLSIATDIPAANAYCIATLGFVEIWAGKDRRNFTNCYVTLEYTKTAD